MEIKNIYIADDGEEFEDEEECLAYEEQMKSIDGVELFTYTFENCTGQGGWNAYEHATYMFIRDPDKAKKYFQYILEQCGYDSPTDCRPGDCFRLDERTGDWINMRDEIQELQDNLLNLVRSAEA